MDERAELELRALACGVTLNTVEQLEAIGREILVDYAFKYLGFEILEINAANGWNKTNPEDWKDTYKVPGILALIHSEVSEALEAFRHDDKENFAEELADIVIRTIDLSAALKIDLGAEIRKKLEVNRQRGFRHGGKRV